MKIVAGYSYSVWNNKLTVYVKDLFGNEFSIAEIDDVNKDDSVNDSLALETLEQLDYRLKDDFNFSNIEKGHTEEEYMELFGYSYNQGELFDVPIEEIFDGSLEKNDDIVYWLIGNRVYETEIPYDHKTNLFKN